MKIVYLRGALSDLIWFRRYYQTVFPQGRRKALRQLEAVERLVVDNPDIGQRNGTAREFPIPKTPFSIIYNVTPNIIEVVRIWDQRRNRDDLEI